MYRAGCGTWDPHRAVDHHGSEQDIVQQAPAAVEQPDQQDQRRQERHRDPEQRPRAWRRARNSPARRTRCAFPDPSSACRASPNAARPARRRNRPAPRSPRPATPARTAPSPVPSVTTPNTAMNRHRQNYRNRKHHQVDQEREKPPRQNAAKQFRLQHGIESMRRNAAVAPPGATRVTRTAIRHDQSLRLCHTRAGHGNRPWACKASSSLTS